jgi:arginase
MNIDVLVVPYDSAHRGLRMGAGPQHLIACGLPAMLERLGHTVVMSTLEPPAGPWRAEPATAFQLATVIASRVKESRDRAHFPLVLSGNCISALGVVAALGDGSSVVWFDAHGDFNTPETTIGGFLDGMAIATITGRCWTAIAGRVPGFMPVAESRVWLVGARDLDPAEEEALQQSPVTRMPASDAGADAGRRACAALADAGPLYVHLDLDVLDPSEGRANGYAVESGISVAALTAMLAPLGGCAAALTVSAYDPSFDADGRVWRAAFAALEAFFSLTE